MTIKSFILHSLGTNALADSSLHNRINNDRKKFYSTFSSNKHSSLLQNRINNNCKKFYITFSGSKHSSLLQNRLITIEKVLH